MANSLTIFSKDGVSNLLKRGASLVFAGSDGKGCCCCSGGCIVTTVTLIRPIVWPGVSKCAKGFSKYKKIKDAPSECRGGTDWRIINLPTCQVIKSGQIDNGELNGLPNDACYPMPYEPPCVTKDSPFTFASLLWGSPLLYLAHSMGLLDTQTIAAILGSLILGLHCDGDLSCRYVLQLQIGCRKNGKVIWPGPDPCVPAIADHNGPGIPWEDNMPDPIVP
jgi:hypothetical protein